MYLNQEQQTYDSTWRFRCSFLSYSLGQPAQEHLNFLMPTLEIWRPFLVTIVFRFFAPLARFRPVIGLSLLLFCSLTALNRRRPMGPVMKASVSSWLLRSASDGRVTLCFSKLIGLSGACAQMEQLSQLWLVWIGAKGDGWRGDGPSSFVNW